VLIYENSSDYSLKFIPTFYLLVYKCVSHDNSIAKAFYKLDSSEDIRKGKREALLPVTAFGDVSVSVFFI